ncbi:MarR family transcriptional regulator [Natrarchaeobaculum aegyptiacum]|uniref:MarR family transcriptional regulator n=1 Tax=Natrarchaeobaculum aegyptiacum TaxID=745377 RepID=A0A2Z2HXC5_9EURY|nr:MarR family transcriptional regulator [Natrarchaeobaculum aegyptiacum]ARS91891.1 MarR family transcriptional regulator [Natrarchaeobaculum aegyptiacum]
MRSHESATQAQLEPVPETIESSQAKLVYLCLEASDGATVEDLTETLTMKKIDVLSVLHSLERDGLVDNRHGEFVVLE